MASYKPPTENLPIFDSSLFDTPNITIPDVSDQYLLFPVAQGAETLKDTTIIGDLLCQQSVEINGVTTINNGLVADTIQAGSIEGISEMSTNNLYCDTLHYVNLDPPISGVSETIQKVLQNGNLAQNETLIGLGGLTMTGIINMQDQAIDNCGTLDMHANIEMGNFNINGVNDLNFVNGDSIGQNSTNTIKFSNVSGVPFYLENGDIQGIDNQQFKLRDDSQDYITISDQGTSQIKLCSQRLLRSLNSTSSANGFGYIMDTLVKPPMYKQIFNGINSTKTLALTAGVPSWIFGVNIYPTGEDLVFNIGINYAEILFSYFQINFTASSPFSPPNTCQLFLSSDPNPTSYDPTKGNAIIFGVVNSSTGQPNYTFTSSVPIILYYQNGSLGASFIDLYLNIQIQDAGTYTVSLQNCNFTITAYVAGKNNQTIVFNG